MSRQWIVTAADGYLGSGVYERLTRRGEPLADWTQACSANQVLCQFDVPLRQLGEAPVSAGEILFGRAIRTEFVYLAVIMDLFTRCIRGWQLGCEPAKKSFL